MEGKVPTWLIDSDVAARVVASSFIDLIAAALKVLFQTNLKFTDGRSAWRWRVAKSKYKLSVGAKLKVGFTGDSWAEKRAITQMMANILHSEYTKASEGWINFASANGDTLNGMSFNISGWTTYDAPETTVAPTYGCALDGLSLYTTGTTARITLNAVSATTLSIYLKNYGEVYSNEYMFCTNQYLHTLYAHLSVSRVSFLHSFRLQPEIRHPILKRPECIRTLHNNRANRITLVQRCL